LCHLALVKFSFLGFTSPATSIPCPATRVHGARQSRARGCSIARRFGEPNMPMPNRSSHGAIRNSNVEAAISLDRRGMCAFEISVSGVV
jgi:hypothetical protein